MTVVPANKLQTKLLKEEQTRLAPDPFGAMEVGCTIIKVFDKDTIDSEEAPEEVVKTIKERPGWLYAQVELLDSDLRHYLPFAESEDQIFLTYGNSVQLEGQLAKIIYRNLDVHNGVIIPQKNATRPLLPLSSLASTLDIGFLV